MGLLRFVMCLLQCAQLYLGGGVFFFGAGILCFSLGVEDDA